MESNIRQAMELLEEAQKKIEEKNYSLASDLLYQAYQIYQILFGIRGIETILLLDRIIEICKIDPALKRLLENYQDEREYLEEGEVESDEYDEY